jgi:hypothetical protein
MPAGLIDSEALTESCRELCELAQALNPEAEPIELMDMAAAALATLLRSRALDAWLLVAMTRAGQQMR